MLSVPPMGPDAGTLMAAFESMSAGVVVTNRDGIIQWINPAFTVLTGYGPDEAVGQNPRLLKSGKHDPDVYRDLWCTILGGKSWRGELINRRKDGTLYIEEQTIAPVRGASGEITHFIGTKIDITERKRAEEEWRKSADRLAVLYNESPLPYQSLDTKGRIVEVNRPWLQTLGYTSEEVIGHWFGEFLAPGYADRFRERFPRFKAAGEVRGVEFLMLRKDGSEVLAAFDGNAGYDARGEFRQTHCVFTDITERKRAEQALRESEERFRNVVESAPEGIVIETQGRFRYMNRAFLELLGAGSQAELLDTPVEDRIHPDCRTEVAKRIRMLNEEGIPQPVIERKYVTLDGRTIDLEVCAAPFTYRGEAGGVAFFRDIAERKRAEAQLRLSAEILKQIPDAILLTDLEGRIVGWTGAAERIFGYTADEAAGRPVNFIHQPEIRDSMTGRIIAQLRDTGQFLGEVPCLRKDGSPVPIETTCRTVFDSEGRPTALIGVNRDISERKRAEEETGRLEAQLQQAQKLESVGRLAGGVAHDFNNLLTVINGYSDLLLSQLAEPDPLWGYASEVRKSGERAAALTQQLLTFSRKQIVEPKPTDLSALVADAERMIRRLVGEDIVVTTVLDPTCGLVIVDPGQIHQVLLNLVVNARDAMPDGGRLFLQTSVTHLDAAYAAAHGEVRPGPYVLLAVSDTGTGMSEETRQHLFEPFFTTKEQGTGSGLGLSIVYGIVRQSGGWIWVYSEPGKGTTFKIYLPQSEAAAAAPVAPGAAPPRGSETILVVEDQEEVRRLATKLLRDYGYRVLEAANGGEALLQAERHQGPIHLLLTDVVMPGMNGRELAERLAPLRPGIQVLYTSGYTHDVIAQRGVLDPGVAYLPKPFTAESLAAKVRQVLGAPQASAKVLIVDDEESVRRFFQRVLRGEGYEVLVARNGKEALELLRHGRPDLVITDLVMPEQDGLEAIRAMRRDNPGVKIVAVSGAFEGEFLRVAQLMGAQATLLKPVSPAQLLNTVRQVLG